MDFEINAGDACNQYEISNFINGPQLSFEHLDWFPSRSRLSEDSTFCLYAHEELQATLSAAPENQDFAWIRFFFTLRDGNHARNFEMLLSHAQGWLSSNQVPELYCLAPSEWITNLLVHNGFELQTQIISLSAATISAAPSTVVTDIIIRPVRLGDLPAIEKLDNLCFAPPWQMNSASLKKSYHTGDYVSLVDISGEVIAYQLTTRFLDNLHLARIAVHPEFRGHGIGKALILDVAQHFKDTKIEVISVNTQVDNGPSLGLYQSLGFRQDGSLLPVFHKRL